MHACSQPAWAVFCGAALLAACGNGESLDQNVEEDPSEHACERAEQAGEVLEGAAARRIDAPELAQSETPYTVTLDQVAPVYLRLIGPADGLLFSNPGNVAKALYFESGAVDELPQGTPNRSCPNVVPEHLELALEETGTYYLELGPAAIDSVWLLYVSAVAFRR